MTEQRIESFLGARTDGDDLVFAIGRELHGGFGGAFGGVVAAAVVLAARRGAPGRVAAGVDCHFLRALPVGEFRAIVSVVHAGRSLTSVRVELRDDRERLTTTATVSFVDPAVLHPLDLAGAATVVDEADWRPFQSRGGVTVPLVEALAPRLAVVEPGVMAAELRIPWDDPGSRHSAEAACMAADFAVGPPVGMAMEGDWRPHPNPDLSVRFAPVSIEGGTVVGTGRIARMAGGLAVVDVDVHAGGIRYAAGAATVLLLGGGEG